MSIDGVKPTATPGTAPIKPQEPEQIRSWGMTEAIRAEGWKGGEAVAETPLRAFGFVEQEKAAPASTEAAPPKEAQPAPAPASAPAPAAASAPALTKDQLDKLTSLRVSAVLDAAKVASGEISGLEASANSALDHVANAPPPAPPPKPKKKKRKKKKCGGVKKIFNKAVGAVKGIVKGAFRFVKGVVKATFSVAKTMFRTTLSLAKSAIKIGGNLLKGDFKGAWQATKDGVKDAGKEIVKGAKETWAHTKDALKGLGQVITNTISLAEATIPGFKVVTDFMKSKLGQKILMGLGILSMIPPLTAVLGPVMLVVALYQGTTMLGAGLENGDFKRAAMGLLTVASSVVGLRGVGKGASAAANATAQKTLNIASNSLKAVDAIERKDWKGAVLAGASAGAAAGGNATAQQVTNIATKGFAAAEAAKKKDWLAVGAAAVAVGAAGLAMASVDTDDSKPKSWFSEKYDAAKNWVGEKWEAFKETPVGQAVMAPVNAVKSGLDATDQYLFGTKVDGVRQPDGLVQKAGNWWSDNVQKPVANFFSPVKTTLSGVSDGIDKGVGALKQPLEDAAGGIDKAAYGEDGKSGAFGALKDGVAKGVDPVKGAWDKGTGVIRDGAAAVAGKLASAVGQEPTAPAGTSGPGGPVVPPAPLGDPAAAAAVAQQEEPGMFAKAWAWVTGKADTAMTNADNIAGKVDAVSQDVGRVHNDLASKLEAINKTHDTFMAGVETVRAVEDGDVNRALRNGSVVMGAAGYTEMGAGMNTLAHKLDAADAVNRGFKEGDLGTALEGAGEFAGLQDVATTGRKINQAKRVQQAAATGNTADLLWEAGRFVESKETQDVADRMYAFEYGQQAMQRGDTAAALTNFGRAAGSRAVESTGDTLWEAQQAKEYADQGQMGNAMYMAGRAAGNDNLQNLGDRVDSAERAGDALQGKDRYGNKLTGAEQVADFMTHTGRATDSQELQTGGLAVNQADALNRAMDTGDEATAQRYGADLAGTLGRKQAAANMNRRADQLDERQNQAYAFGSAAEDGRMGDLVDDVAATQGMKAQQLEASQDAKEFEKRAQKTGESLAAIEKLGKKIT